VALIVGVVGVLAVLALGAVVLLGGDDDGDGAGADAVPDGVDVRIDEVTEVGGPAGRLRIDWVPVGFTASLQDGFYHGRFYFTDSDAEGGAPPTEGTPTYDSDAVPFVSAEMRRLDWPAGARQVCVTAVDSDGRIVDADLYDCAPLPEV
jgi:hypothetical protein